MATAPMNPAMAEGEQETPQPTGFTICIDVAPDGAMKVSSEPMEAEMPEEGESAALPAASLEEAMGIAQQIIDAKGEMPKGNGMSVEDAFSQGFQGTEVA